MSQEKRPSETRSSLREKKIHKRRAPCSVAQFLLAVAGPSTFVHNLESMDLKKQQTHNPLYYHIALGIAKARGLETNEPNCPCQFCPPGLLGSGSIFCEREEVRS